MIQRLNCWEKFKQAKCEYQAAMAGEEGLITILDVMTTSSVKDGMLMKEKRTHAGDVSGQRRCEEGRVNARRNGMARNEHELE